MLKQTHINASCNGMTYRKPWLFNVVQMNTVNFRNHKSKQARRTARASSIDETGLIIKSKATFAPPRAGTTGKPQTAV